MAELTLNLSMSLTVNQCGGLFKSLSAAAQSLIIVVFVFVIDMSHRVRQRSGHQGSPMAHPKRAKEFVLVRV
jgi:hypothetical protein